MQLTAIFCSASCRNKSVKSFFWKRSKIIRITRITTFLLVLVSLHIAANARSQTISLSVKETSLKTVIQQIEKQSDYSFIYGEELLKKSNPVTVQITGASIGEVLEAVFKNQPLDYKITDKYIVLSLGQPGKVAVVDLPPLPIRISGRVTNEDGDPVTGATVSVRGIRRATTTDKEGYFTLNTTGTTAHITITSVGYAPITVVVQDKTLFVEAQKEAGDVKTENNAKSSAAMDQNGVISVKLARLIRQQDEVVITGIVNKKKESFTGAAATYTQKELLQVGGTNVLQSLKTLDPAFNMRDNVQFGSDPNQLPNLEIRGKTGLLGERDALSTDPNQPLFILDGFESSLKIINDLDINRVESITILKDAASTAIYGSKAANGVVVVETVKPKAGKLQVNYSTRFNISAPDLSSYNMMDAREKLEFERLTGRFDPNYANAASPTEAELKMAALYNELHRMIEDEGVNTYWMGEPLRVGRDQNHSLSVGGGQGDFLFNLAGSYNGTTGVMKGSEKKRYQGDISLIYRKSKLQFTNNFTVQAARYQKELVPFASFSRANPYFKKTHNGVLDPLLYSLGTPVASNPIWNFTRNSRNTGKDIQFRNLFMLDWRPSKSWMIRTNVGLTMDDNDTEIFASPEDTREWGKVLHRRGSFNYAITKRFNTQGQLTVSYAKLMNKHQINLTGLGNINSNNSVTQGYSAEGFPTYTTGNFTYPNFSRGYPEQGKPAYRNDIARSLDFSFIGAYSFNSRFLMDLSLRSSGSSVFGTNRRFNNTWAIGVGWNLHNEEFVRSNFAWINFFKIRGSVGNPGNQNFSAQRALITYQYIPNIQSYFGLGAQPNALGDPDLQWQVTQDKNIGVDLTAFNRRFGLAVDYYHKLTNPLLIKIDMPLSAGASSNYTNAGQQTVQGLNFLMSYQILNNTQRRILWGIRVTGRTEKQRIDGIGNKLDKFNVGGRGKSLIRYRDGADPDDMWAVRSLGIDPASGRELFLDKDGNYTFSFFHDNEVVVGNTRPDLDGVVGSNLTLGGFSLNLGFRYQFGAEVFNTALRDKVENVNMLENQDRRALYERWHKPGDIRPFRNIRDNVNLSSPMSSRYVQTEKTFTLESLYVSYDFRNGWVKKAGLGTVRVFASARDVFRFSTMQIERGIDYPFARVFDTGLSINF